MFLLRDDANVAIRLRSLGLGYAKSNEYPNQLLWQRVEILGEVTARGDD